MEALDNQDALKMVTLFSGAVKGMAFYPASHPSIRQPMLELDKILVQAHGRVPEVSWGILDGAMFFEGHLFINPPTAVVEMTNRMMEKDISRITVAAGLTFDELQNFIRLFSARSVGFDALVEQMRQGGIAHIRLLRQGEERIETPDEKQAEREGEVEGEGEGEYVVTYGQALNAIRDICRDIECGRIPSSAPIVRVVDRMVGITMQEPSILVGLTMIKDYDNYTFNHCVNVGILSMALGASLGMDAKSVKALGVAGELHDIGKTMIPKKILNKPGKLSSDEYDEMKRHSELGAKIVREMEGLDPHVAQVVLGHHLHFDRCGYPQWAQKLPFNQMVDIVAIADTFDAITTLRVYQHPINPRAALQEMQKLAGTFLDASLLASFIEMMGKYPVGTLVRLDTNEVAVVYRPNPLDEEAPLVRVLIESNGTRLAVPREQSLIMQDGARYAEIVAVVDPLLKNIDVGKFVVSGNY